MSPDRFHVDIGPPEESPTPGAQYTFPQRTVRIEATIGFRDLGLPQLDGVVLALDWVANNRHHTWGSAVMVAPGIALTAGHVVDEMRERGFLAEGGGQLFAVSFHADRVELWRADSFTRVDAGDLSLLTLVRTTARSGASAENPLKFGLARMAARMPSVGETISLIGFRAAEEAFEGKALMGLGDADERSVVTVEGFDDPGEIHQAAGEPVDLVDYHNIDPALGDVLQQALDCRTVHVAAGPATVIIEIGQTFPALASLAEDIGFSGCPLRIERVELLLQSLLARFAGIDRAAEAGFGLGHRKLA